jgi:hypothetical protein
VFKKLSRTALEWTRWIRICISRYDCSKMPPNLTEEQKDLLRAIVKVYDSGCKGAFILVQQLSGPTGLVYEGHPGLETEADVEDFNQLRNEGVLTFTALGDNSEVNPTQ